MNINLNDILKINFLEIIHLNGLEPQIFKGVSIDSRKVRKGEIFVALRGKNSDGHDYILQSYRNGAALLVIDKKYFNKNEKKLLGKDKINSPIVVVEDTLIALGELANVYRRKFNIPFIAIAGSNGKTTTKEMIAAVLSQKFNVLASEGNYNNQIGVPLTLFRLNEKHDIGVIELGTNKFGEINYLCKIVDPSYGLITNIGNEHLEFFKDKKGVAKEELSLFNYLASKNYSSLAFVNADYKEILKAGKKVKNRFLYSIRSSKVNLKIDNLKEHNGKYSFDIINQQKDEKFSVKLNLQGMHNVENALAAASVGIVFGVPSIKIKKALENFKPVDKRMQVLNLKDTTIINDTYNANLDSTLHAMQVLNSMKAKGKKIFVFGDMLELGKKSQENHTEVGKKYFQYAKQSNVPMYLITFGKHTKHTYKAAGNITKAHFLNKKQLIKYVTELVNSNDLILVKGSRGMKMEEVVESIVNKLKNK